MTNEDYVLISDGAATKVGVTLQNGNPHISAAALAGATGWTVKPEGFCYEAICIPAGSATTSDGAVNLTAFAKLTGKPLIVDTDQRAISLGTAPAMRAASMQSLQAPDFTLPDLNGEMHSLSQYRGKKILLAVYGSW